MPEYAGLYFSWGNTDGHPKGSSYDFSQEVYNETPAASISTDLTPNEDAASVKLGYPCRMPTTADIEELNTYCSSEYSQVNGVPGRLFTSIINGESVFFPLLGFYNRTTLQGSDVGGYYWTSSWRDETRAHYLQVTTNIVHTEYVSDRNYGFLIRPVLPGNPNRSVIPPIPEDESKDEETPTVEEPKDDNER